jgi:hypothetical protein
MSTPPETEVSNYCLGLVLGYCKGYEKGLYALEPQVPYSVKGMWKAASKAAAEKHFQEDTEFKTMYERCLKNEGVAFK